MCASSGELFYQCDTRFMSLCVDGRLVCISECHLHTVTYTRCRIDTVNSPGDGHIAVRNM